MDIKVKRLQVVQAAQDIGISKAAELYELNRKTVSNWLKKYLTDGHEGLKNRDHKQQKQPLALQNNLVDQIIAYKSRLPDASSKEIKAELKLDCSTATICRYLREAKLKSEPAQVQQARHLYYLKVMKIPGQNNPFLLVLVNLSTGFNLAGFAAERTKTEIIRFINAAAESMRDKLITILHEIPFISKNIIFSTNNQVVLQHLSKSDKAEIINPTYLFPADYHSFHCITEFELLARLLLFNYRSCSDQLHKTFVLMADNTSINHLNSFAELINCLLKIAVELQKNKNWEGSIDVFNLIEKISEMSGKNYYHCDAIAKKAQILIKTGKLLDAEYNYVKSLRYAEKFSHFDLSTKICGLLGALYQQQGKNRQAVRLFARQLELSIKHNLPEEECLAYLSLGVLNNAVGHTNKALYFYQKSIENSRQTGQKNSRLTALGNIGVIYLRKNNCINAIEYYKAALTMAEETGNKRQITRMLINLAVAYDSVHNNQLATEYNLKALELARELNLHQFLATVLINLGDNYLQRDEFARAMNNFREALTICEKHGFKEQKSIAYSGMSSIYKQIGKTKQAEKALNEAVKTGIETGDMYYLASFYLAEAMLLINEKRFAAAQEKLNLTKKTAELTGRQDLLLEINLLIVKLNKIMNLLTPQEALNEYMILLGTVKSRENKAEIIINMLEQSSDELSLEEIKKYRNYALKQYKELYAKSHHPFFLKSIARLQLY